jgi:replicative DNA helicase
MIKDRDPIIERQLICLAINEPRHRPVIFKTVQSDWFTDEKHKKLFQICFELYLSATEYGIVEVHALMQSHSEFTGSDVGTLLEQADSGCESPNILSNSLKLMYVKRMTKHCLMVAAGSLDANEDPIKTASYVSGELIRVANGIYRDEEPDPSELVIDALDRYGTKKPPGIKSGIHVWDNWMGGIVPGRLYVLAATKKTGKTRMVVSALSNIACEGHDCSMVSLEMRPSEITDLLFSMQTGVDSSHIQNQELNQAELGRISSQAGTVRSILDKLHIISPRLITIAGLSAIIRHHAGFHKSKVIAIDFLGKIVIDFKHENAERGRICSVLADLARDLNIAIILIAQLNKMAETEKSPNIGLVEGSGQITQFADAIILVVNQTRTGEQKEGFAETQKLKIHFTQRSGASSPFVDMLVKLQILDFNLPTGAGF